MSEFFLLVQQIVNSRAVVEFFVFDAFNNVVQVVSVQFLYFLRLLGVNHDLRSVQRLQIRGGVTLDLTRSSHIGLLPGCSLGPLVLDLHVEAHETIVSWLFVVGRRVLVLPVAILFISVVFVVDAVIELSIVVEHVLSVDFFALIREIEHAFADQQVLNAVAFVERIRNMALG